MDASSTLDTFDTDANVVAVARRHLDSDPRVTFHVINGAEFQQRSSSLFDLIMPMRGLASSAILTRRLHSLRPAASM